MSLHASSHADVNPKNILYKFYFSVAFSFAL